MREVEVKVDLAKDGSGWSFSKDNSLRTAYVWKEGSETYNGSNPHLILPLTEGEEQTFEKNIIESDGIRGLKLTNVWDSYIVEQ